MIYDYSYQNLCDVNKIWNEDYHKLRAVNVQVDKVGYRSAVWRRWDEELCNIFESLKIKK